VKSARVADGDAVVAHLPIGGECYSGLEVAFPGFRFVAFGIGAEVFRRFNGAVGGDPGGLTRPRVSFSLPKSAQIGATASSRSRVMVLTSRDILSASENAAWISVGVTVG
jgi:hypothetical protein